MSYGSAPAFPVVVVPTAASTGIVAVGAANAAGADGGEYARAAHVHDHGSQTTGTHHAVANASGAAGFMSASDKGKLDGLPTSAVATSRLISTTAPLAGGGDLSADRTLSMPAATSAAAGHATALQIAKLDGLPASAVPTARLLSTTSPITGGGDLSADRTFAIPAATAAAPGHATAAQITKLDGIAASAAALTGVAPLTIAAANALGASATAAKGDHAHAHGAQTDGTMHAVAVAAGAAGFLSGADKTKLDGIATAATKGLTTTSIRATATQTLSATAVANLTNMVLAVTSGVTYAVTARLLFTSAATTTGVRFAITHPGGTLSILATVPIAADGTAAAWSGVITASGTDVVQSTGVEAISTTYCAIYEGVYVCTVSGSLQCQGGTEVGASNIVVQPGSHLVLEAIP